ncbi:MAG TPA: FMN-binding protein [Candidatus Hypogeohydataceae bacterium YC38]|nr:FMN-binding protein [Candidatus Brocadiales bacterium]
MGKRIQYTLVLGIISIITAVGVGVTYVVTKEKILQREDARRMEAILTVLPGIKGSPQELTPTETAPEDKVYTAVGEGDAPIGYAALGEAQGYSSKIKVMVGLDPGLDKVLGVKILFQQETPGLGTRVMEIATTKTLWNMFFGAKAAVTEEINLNPWFQEQFRGKALNQLEVVRQQDPEKIVAITGATITTKAVTAAVKNAIEKITKTARAK